MLANSDRLKKNKEFDLVFKEGRTVYGEFLGIKARKNNLNNNRFGVLLSTKVSKSAVERNLYKRRIKAIISQENLKIKTGQDCVIIVLPVIIGKKAQEIKTEIQNIFIKLKFYN
ncbi:MAG: ribonuclease P protein component [Candidatus Falkowbacteria bacterium]